MGQTDGCHEMMAPGHGHGSTSTSSSAPKSHGFGEASRLLLVFSLPFLQREATGQEVPEEPGELPPWESVSKQLDSSQGRS